MSKTLFQSHNNESIVALGLSMTIVVLVVVNFIVLIPALMTAYAPPSNLESAEPINTQVVNEALTIIEGSAD